LDPNCQCRQTNTCAKAEFGNVSFGNQQMPGFFTSSLGNAGAGANALFAGNTSAANSQFAQMGQNAAKIRKLHDQVKANADKVIKDKTKGKQSFADFEKDALNKLTKMSKQVIPKLAAEQPALMAGLGFGGKPVPNAKEEMKNKTPAAIVASIQAAAKEKKAADPFADFKFDFGDEEVKPEEKTAVLNQGEALGDFVTNESDIS